MFTAISARSSADEVFDQVANEIVSGGLGVGSSLPGERELAAKLGVSRSVVREGLQRLSQAGLIEIRQGDSTRIRDYTTSTDIGLLGRLLVTETGVNVELIRSILQARTAIGADASRLCATSASDATVAQLRSQMLRMAQTDDIAELQRLDLEFWEIVVVGSGNLVYRLAYNGLAATYRPAIDMITALVEPELADLSHHHELVTAIADSDGIGAHSLATQILMASNSEWDSLLQSFATKEDE